MAQKPGECARWNDSDLGPKGPPFPNCSEATGLPWYDHDGYHNPLGDEMDSPQLHKMADAVEALTLSAFYTGSAAHGERAAALLRAWFLDPATRMNPNADCKCRGSSVASLKSRMARSLKGATARSCTRHPGQVRRAGDWPHRLCKRVADPPRLRGAAGVARALAGVRRGGSEAVDGVVARLDAGLA